MDLDAQCPLWVGPGVQNLASDCMQTLADICMDMLHMRVGMPAARNLWHEAVHHIH